MDWSSPTQESALYCAVHYNSKKVVKQLLSYGADLNAEGGIYGTPLQLAVVRDRSLVAKLLDEGADPNASSSGRFGNSLQAAAFFAYLKATKLLLKKELSLTWSAVCLAPLCWQRPGFPAIACLLSAVSFE